MSDIIIYNPGRLTTERPDYFTDMVYFPNFGAARAVLDSHIASRPSTRTTGHTKNSYNASLDRFLRFIEEGDGYKEYFPDKPTFLKYIAYLMDECKLSASTVNVNLAPVRIFLSALSEQPINSSIADQEFRMLNEIRNNVAAASKVKNPPSEKSSSMSPLQTYGNRLEGYQIKELMALIDRRTLTGKRDYALLKLGLLTGLRRAELQRITLANFDISSPRTDIIRGLVGKRNKTGDIPCPKDVYGAIKDYVDAFNAKLREGDVRRIQPDEPVWRNLTRSGNIPKNREIMGMYGITRIVSRRHTDFKQLTDPNYNPEKDPKRFTCHDLRRTMIARASADTDIPAEKIIKISRHESLDMFLKYRGDLVNLEDLNLSDHGYRID